MMSVLLSLKRLYERVFAFVDRVTEGWLLPTLARFTFLAVLFVFFWKSAMTKVGDGIFGLFSPATGAYFQIVPKAVEAAGYQPAKVGLTADLVVLFGMWAEILLPILIVVGLFTRLAALGMIGFVTVMTYVDLTAHGLKPEVVGGLFDASAGGLWDQRLLWVLVLLVPLLKGPGPLSLDRLLGWLLARRSGRVQPHAPLPGSEASGLSG